MDQYVKAREAELWARTGFNRELDRISPTSLFENIILLNGEKTNWNAVKDVTFRFGTDPKILTEVLSRHLTRTTLEKTASSKLSEELTKLAPCSNVRFCTHPYFRRIKGYTSIDERHGYPLVIHHPQGGFLRGQRRLKVIEIGLQFVKWMIDHTRTTTSFSKVDMPFQPINPLERAVCAHMSYSFLAIIYKQEYQKILTQSIFEGFSRMINFEWSNWHTNTAHTREIGIYAHNYFQKVTGVRSQESDHHLFTVLEKVPTEHPYEEKYAYLNSTERSLFLEWFKLKKDLALEIPRP